MVGWGASPVGVQPIQIIGESLERTFREESAKPRISEIPPFSD
jgi:hypothetical protein